MTVSCHLTPPSAPTHQRVTGGGSYTHFADEEIEVPPIPKYIDSIFQRSLGCPMFLGHQYHLWPGRAQPSLPPSSHSTGAIRVTCCSLLPQDTASQRRGPGRAPAELTSRISSPVQSTASLMPYSHSPLHRHPLTSTVPSARCALLRDGLNVKNIVFLKKQEYHLFS